MGGVGFRVIRVDATINAEETQRLLSAAFCSLLPGGILIFEGLQSVNGRPGAQEGFHRFMHEGVIRGSKRQVPKPFLWAGPLGGVFMTTSGHYADLYRDGLQKSLHENAFINKVHDTKRLYGEEMLSLSPWKLTLEMFENLLD